MKEHRRIVKRILNRTRFPSREHVSNSFLSEEEGFLLTCYCSHSEHIREEDELGIEGSTSTFSLEDEYEDGKDWMRVN